MTYRTIVPLIVATLLGAPAFAQSQGQRPSEDNSTSAAVIEERYQRVYRQRALGRKLGAMEYQRLARQRAKVNELIERAEAGQTVTTDDVDRALGLTR